MDNHSFLRGRGTSISLDCHIILYVITEGESVSFTLFKVKPQSFSSGWRAWCIQSNKKEGLCYIWIEPHLSCQSLERGNGTENNALWNIPRSVPIQWIHYYLRQILPQLRNWWFSVWTTWLSIKENNTYRWGWSQVTSQIMTNYSFLKEKKSDLTNSKWRKFIHNLHVRTIVERRERGHLVRRMFLNSVGFLPECGLCGRHHPALALDLPCCSLKASDLCAGPSWQCTFFSVAADLLLLVRISVPFWIGLILPFLISKQAFSCILLPCVACT